LTSLSRVATAQVFAIAGPAIVANLTTPLIGIVSTIAIGRLGDTTLLGGVAIASVIFDCLFWLFAFLRMSTVAFNNFLLISAFFLDGLANAAEQLCGRAYGARDRIAFTSATRLVIVWGFAFALAVTAAYALFGPVLIDIMTASEDVRHSARDYLWLVALAPLLGVFAFVYDGIFTGATWARDMRNLMVLSLLIFLSAWLALRSFGNAGLWGALLVHYAARGGLQALRYPALLKASFAAAA
jgi:MATE family multidrug resistance protein